MADDTLVPCYAELDASDLTDLPPQLKLKELHLRNINSQWIRHPLSPFDLSCIRDVECGFISLVSASKFIDPWRLSLNRLVIRAYPRTWSFCACIPMAPDCVFLYAAAYEDEKSLLYSVQPLAGLRALAHLTIVAVHTSHLEIVPNLLAPLLLANRLQHLEFQIDDPIGGTSLQRLGRGLPLTAFPTLRRLTVLVLAHP